MSARLSLKMLLVFISIILLTGCAQLPVSRYSGIVWGTSYNVSVVGDVRPNEIAAIVNSVLDSIDNEVNMFNPVSELGRFNSVGAIEPSVGFKAVLGGARAVAFLTGGAFEPTVGALVEYWGFGTDKEARSVTDTVGLARARESVGLDKVVDEGKTVKRLHPGLRLDFGAIAKGFAVDRVSAALKSRGFDRHLVEIGGEVRVSGRNSGDEPWAIQIDKPVVDSIVSHHQLGILRLTDGAVATSGNYRNFRRLDDGTIVAHTIDPVSGVPVQTDLLSVTIVDISTMRADALATAAMVMGLDKALKLTKKLQEDHDSGFIGAIFVTHDGVTTVGLTSENASFTLSAKRIS